MPLQPRPDKVTRTKTAFERGQAKARVACYVDENCRLILEPLRDRLLSDFGVTVSTPSVHRALYGVPYSVTKLHKEKTTMNYTVSKTECKELIDTLNAHINTGNMCIFHGETNFNLYMEERLEDKFRVGDRATVDLPPTKAKNLRVQGGVSVAAFITHEGSIKNEEDARFIADLFLASLRSEEYRGFDSAKKVVSMMDNTPAHIGVEEQAFKVLTEDGIMNLARLTLLRLGLYSPMLNHMDVYWMSINAKMKHYLTKVIMK
ncbi:Transposase [Phytophthora palmivora]|uniref:Transposase n=1 Tax=Phytophthora palmivora TaxID=4796 RepID=A0A2P4YL81_9STRA|nr:Transposase [Phytophthora palmivora]